VGDIGVSSADPNRGKRNGSRIEEAEVLDRLRLVGEAFRPAAPIDRRSLFSGRSEQISELFSIAAQPGQHAVIFGERGVGKTSLAAVTAEMFKSANILVARPDHVGLVDFGQVGKLTDDDMAKLTRLFIDAANENVDNLPKRLADLGVRYPKQREDEFRARLQELYYKYYGATLAEIDPIQVIREAFQLIYSMNLRLPTRYVLLDKAIATLGSVGIELYEDFNVFEVAKPYAQSLLRERFGPAYLTRRTRREAVRLAQVVAELPYQVHDTLEQMRDGQVEIGFVHKGLDDLMAKLDVLFNRLVVALVVTGGLIGSSLIGIFAKHGPQLFGVNALSVIGFFLSGLLGVWLMWGVIRSGRL